MLAVAIFATPAASQARVSVGIAVSFGPPVLPIYYQPPCPGYGYLWTPGYWAWDPDYGYYWVPGTWVMPPFEGALWTPGYWGYDDGLYVWYTGYWGPVVGYYGGIDYGFGYTGYGYQGGYWRADHLYYNRTVNNIRTTNIKYVYSQRVVNNTSGARPSYNGGPEGTRVRPTSRQLAAARMRRRGPVQAQERQMQIAQRNPQQRARINHGRPAIAATARPGAFSGGEAVQATRAGAPYHTPKQMLHGHGAESSMPAARPAPERSNAHATRSPRMENPPRANRPAPSRVERVNPTLSRRESSRQAVHVKVEHARPQHQPEMHDQRHKPPDRGGPGRFMNQRAMMERPQRRGSPHGR